MVQNAWLVISAWDAGELVGMARVVGDGVTVAYIHDLLVDPDHQRRGIGRALLTEVLDETSHIRQVYITTDDPLWNRHVVKLYRSLGFRPPRTWAAPRSPSCGEPMRLSSPSSRLSFQSSVPSCSRM